MKDIIKTIIKNLANKKEDLLINLLYVKCMKCEKIKTIKEINLVNYPNNPQIRVIDNHITTIEEVRIWCKDCIKEKSNEE